MTQHPKTNTLDFVIVGTPRSGTTLVQRLACELSGVVMPPETHFLSLHAPELIRRQTFPLDHAAIRAELEAFAARPTSAPLGLDPEAVVERVGDSCASAAELFAAVVHAVAGDASRVGEKTPSHLLWWRPLAAAFPDMKFVVVVRDPRAVVASNLEVPWGMRSTAALAARWCSDQQQARALLDSLGERALLLRYEDVVSDASAARSAVATLLGVAPVAGPTTLVAPPEPWKRRALEPPDEARADRWRSVLKPHQLRVIERLTEPLATSFGYAPAARRHVVLGPLERSRAVRFRRARAAAVASIDRLASDPAFVGAGAPS